MNIDKMGLISDSDLEVLASHSIHTENTEEVTASAGAAAGAPFGALAGASAGAS